MEECPVCKNKIGFAFGTCIQCGYDHIEEKFSRIEVDMEILERLLDPYTVEYLVRSHENKYKDRYTFDRYK
jgi:hypothetical protein